MRNLNIQMVSDLVEENGRTIRENNLDRQHELPIGALVQVDNECTGSGSQWTRVVQGYIAVLGRDCDGTPLYYLTIREHDLLDAQIEHDCRHELYEKSQADGPGSEAELDYQAIIRWTSMSNLFGGFTSESLTVIDENEGFLDYLQEQYRFDADDKRDFLMNIRRRL
jgi:hypothetical protein